MVIMDEPTAALGVEECEKVLQLIRDIRNAGTAVLIISHNMTHVFEVADRVVVLRLGRKVAESDRKDTSMDQVVSWITGSSAQAELCSK